LDDFARTIRNALPEAVFAASVEPEDGGKLAMVPSGELNRKLGLADSAKSVKHKYPLSATLLSG